MYLQTHELQSSRTQKGKANGFQQNMLKCAETKGPPEASQEVEDEEQAGLYIARSRKNRSKTLIWALGKPFSLGSDGETPPRPHRHLLCHTLPQA